MVGEPRGSVTNWIGGLKQGDEQAVKSLWDRYFPRLVALARTRLCQGQRIAADEEDAALGAFASLWKGAVRGDFELLTDRDDLWKLLTVLTARKSTDQKRWSTRQRRGGGRTLAEVDFAEPSPGEGAILEQVAAVVPTPEFAAILAEESRRRLDSLGDESLRLVAQLRLEGYSNLEIADRLGCARRTVARKLDMIRQAWSQSKP